MIDGAIKQIINDLKFETTSSYGERLQPNPDYDSIPFTKDNFYEFNGNPNQRKIAFIDGGTQKLFQTPTLSILLNRVYYNVYKGVERIKKLNYSFDFFSVTTAKLINNNPLYRTKLYPITSDKITFFPNNSDVIEFEPRSEMKENDETILDIDRVSPIARRFGEWAISSHVLQELNEGDLIVMDGTLKSSFPSESSYTGSLFSKSQSKGVIYCGLAKSSGLLTDRGYPLLSTLKKLSIQSDIKPPWYYHPVARSKSPTHAADLLIVKLSKYSKRIFRLDIQSKSFKNLSIKELHEIMSQLSYNSSDVSFPGYPYGLIDADLNARVKYNEIEKYQTHLSMEMSKKEYWQDFLDDIQSIDAHGILNFLSRGN